MNSCAAPSWARSRWLWRGAARRLPDPAPDVAFRRRHGHASCPARRSAISSRAVAAGHDDRRRRRGLRRRGRLGRHRARHRAARDASLAAFYLLSLALGVTIVSVRGSNVDLLHVLFGSVLALDNATMILLASIASVTWSASPSFIAPGDGYARPRLPVVGQRRRRVDHIAFLGFVALNLVAGFHALGTLLAVGAMMLPASARDSGLKTSPE